MPEFFEVFYGIIPFGSIFIIALISFTILMWLIGRKWEKSLIMPPKPSGKEKVWVVIASYKSAATIRETIESVMKSDYSNKEILVVDDTPDESVVEACKGLSVKIIRNKKRIGKARSINRAIKDIKSGLILFLDSDSIINEGFIANLASWFCDSKIAAVSPLFDTKNREGILRRFTSLESSFWFTVARTQMFFGSMISFRGCGFMVRASAFWKVRGFDETLTEDVALAGKLIKSGYRIAYDPRALVLTDEPETLKDFYRQRFRWGKGGFFAFIRNMKIYIKPQIMVALFPHGAILAGFMLLLTYQSIAILSAIIPSNPFALPLSGMVEEVSAIIAIAIINYLATVTASSPHSIVYSYKGIRSAKEALLIIPYAFFYMPVLFTIYTLGIIAGAKDRIKYGKGVNELHMKDWKK